MSLAEGSAHGIAQLNAGKAYLLQEQSVKQLQDVGFSEQTARAMTRVFDLVVSREIQLDAARDLLLEGGLTDRQAEAVVRAVAHLIAVYDKVA